MIHPVETKLAKDSGESSSFWRNWSRKSTSTKRTRRLKRACRLQSLLVLVMFLLHILLIPPQMRMRQFSHFSITPLSVFLCLRYIQADVCRSVVEKRWNQQCLPHKFLDPERHLVDPQRLNVFARLLWICSHHSTLPIWSATPAVAGY